MSDTTESKAAPTPGPRYILRDTEHRAPCLGGMPSDHDHCIVYDTTRKTRNPLTGKTQNRSVFSGTRARCAAWIREASDE